MLADQISYSLPYFNLLPSHVRTQKHTWSAGQRQRKTEAAAHAEAQQRAQAALTAGAEAAAAAVSRAEGERDALRAALTAAEDRLQAAVQVQRTPGRGKAAGLPLCKHVRMSPSLRSTGIS